MNTPDRDEPEELFAKIWNRKGTIEQAEQWFTRLKQIDPSYSYTHTGWYLALQIRARPVYDRLRDRMGEHLSKVQIIELVDKIQRFEGTDEELEAYLWLVQESVPNPTVYFHPEERTAETVVADALASNPIVICIGSRT